MVDQRGKWEEFDEMSSQRALRRPLLEEPVLLEGAGFAAVDPEADDEDPDEFEVEAEFELVGFTVTALFVAPFPLPATDTEPPTAPLAIEPLFEPSVIRGISSVSSSPKIP